MYMGQRAVARKGLNLCWIRAAVAGGRPAMVQEVQDLCTQVDKEKKKRVVNRHTLVQNLQDFYILASLS